MGSKAYLNALPSISAVDRRCLPRNELPHMKRSMTIATMGYTTIWNVRKPRKCAGVRDHVLMLRDSVKRFPND
jgi:hypothetical protein